MRRTERNGDFIIRTHPHAELPQSVALGDFDEKLKMQRRLFIHGAEYTSGP